jgi:hypothetical protein
MSIFFKGLGKPPVWDYYIHRSLVGLKEDLYDSLFWIILFIIES